MIIRKITPLKMKAVIATDSISLLPLRGRHLPFTRPRAATLSGIHHALGNFADNHTIFHANIDLKWRIYDFSNNFLSFMDIQPNIILEIFAP